MNAEDRNFPVPESTRDASVRAISGDTAWSRPQCASAGIDADGDCG